MCDVRRSASSWLIAADKYGVQSPEAVRLATVHRAAMNHRRLRTDASLFLRSSRLDSGSLLELHLQSLPHYMNPAEGGVNAWDKANTSRSLVQHFYQSTSVLGQYACHVIEMYDNKVVFVLSKTSVCVCARRSV